MTFSPSDTRNGNANSVPPASPMFHRSLGTISVTAHGVAAIGLTATAMVNIPQIVALAGQMTWVCYLAASLVIVLVCETVIFFRKIPATADGIAGFVRDQYGDRLGNFAAWTLLLGYLGNSLNCLTVFGYYLDHFFHRAGYNVWLVVGFLIGGVLCYFLARRDVKFSAMTMLWTEIPAIIAVVALCILILAGIGKPNPLPELPESSQAEPAVNIFQRGMILAILSFVGFESTATLGLESVNPSKTIPRSLRWSVWLSAGLFLFWAFVLGEGLKWLPLEQQTKKNTLILLADRMNIPGAGMTINLGAFICFFGATLANLMSMGRVIFALSERGYLIPALATINPQLRTPARALLVSSVIVTLICCLLSLAGFSVVEMFDDTGSFAVLGFLCCYILVALSAAFLPRTHESSTRLLPILTTIALLAVSASFLIGSAGSMIAVLVIFMILLVAGAIRAFQKQSPKSQINTI